MKKVLFLAAALLATSISFAQNSKAFERGNMYHQLGIGGQGYWTVGSEAPGNGYWYGYNNSYYSNLTIQYQAEWGIHDYVGLGFHAGLSTGRLTTNAPSLYIPLGLQANFHFYQLIDDKVSSDIKSDKLDIYGGLNFGAGPAFLPKGDLVYGGIHGGPQLGVRFYPKSNVGMFLEVGYGKSFGQFGLVIR